MSKPALAVVSARPPHPKQWVSAGEKQRTAQRAWPKITAAIELDGVRPAAARSLQGGTGAPGRGTEQPSNRRRRSARE